MSFIPEPKKQKPQSSPPPYKEPKSKQDPNYEPKPPLIPYYQNIVPQLHKYHPPPFPQTLYEIEGGYFGNMEPMDVWAYG